MSTRAVVHCTCAGSTTLRVTFIVCRQQSHTYENSILDETEYKTQQQAASCDSVQKDQRPARRRSSRSLLHPYPSVNARASRPAKLLNCRYARLWAAGCTCCATSSCSLIKHAETAYPSQEGAQAWEPRHAGRRTERAKLLDAFVLAVAVLPTPRARSGHSRP